MASTRTPPRRVVPPQVSKISSHFSRLHLLLHILYLKPGLFSWNAICWNKRTPWYWRSLMLNLCSLSVTQVSRHRVRLPYISRLVAATNHVYRRNGQTRGEYPCIVCGRVFRWKKGLDTHRKLECGKEPQFQCPFCEHRSKLKGNLTKHIRRRHTTQDSV